MVLNRLVASVRATGALGVVGVYPKEDKKSPDKLMKEGQIAFDYGAFFTKGLRMGTGQADVKRYNRHLRDLIHNGSATPSFIVSHHPPLAEAPDAYKHLDARERGWTKVILRPAGERRPQALHPRPPVALRREALVQRAVLSLLGRHLTPEVAGRSQPAVAFLDRLAQRRDLLCLRERRIDRARSVFQHSASLARMEPPSYTCRLVRRQEDASRQSCVVPSPLTRRASCSHGAA